ncbi:helix-turn-helix domain-containing protein [Cellulomonas sp. P22]|uniref:helix-turn-helix domain-containing protein n=1 Tax=Cellulomonas sp. P22 TaxID=3373189 RepID=UPI00379CC380
MANHQDVLKAVGPRLRALRLKSRRTLADVSEATGISISTLSRLESGLRRPTLELLLPLAETYQVHLDELVKAPATGDPRIHLTPLRVRGSTYIPLTRRPGGVQAYKQVIAPNWPTAPPELSVHPGYEWMYVLSGQVRLLLGDQDVTLSVGEVAEFDTNLPHFVGNPGPHPAEILSLFGRQGERMHVRARPRTADRG